MRYQGLNWHLARSPRVALNLHIYLHRSLIGDKCTCFFIYRALQVYTERFNSKKTNTPNPPALELCGIKVINGARTLSNRQALDSSWPLWPGALRLGIPCKPAAPSMPSAFVHPCLRQKGLEGASAIKHGCFGASSELAPLFLSSGSLFRCCIPRSWSYKQ